ncbi:Mlp family lipoprotein [Borreliella tanukii]|uniref:Mlp family lipoprotein n=1 Tax=Borreliella tanukii TaxID=56146 RepID=UPI002649189A|nr:Mlp family lipoprotein [Borreliella tanukii]WKC79399.1 Mlp family lipoprotein [Borreliella tanukii]
MKRIGILSIILLFSCKQYGEVKSLTEIASDFEDNNSLVVSDNVSAKDSIAEVGPALTSEESKKLESLKTFLKDAMGVNGKKGDVKAEYEKSYKEFFDWLSKDVNKQKEFVNSFNNICGIVTKSVDASKKKYSNDGKQALDFDEYVCYDIKTRTGDDLSLFFQKVADAFGTQEYKNKDENNDENNQKPEKCNEEIFKVIKRVFTESESNNELKNLKNYGNNHGNV